MKEPIQLPKSRHSYDEHRRQFWLQIFLPISLAIVLIVVIAVILSVAALGGTGNSVRWAAISTIWLVIPAMFFGLLFLATLGGLVYLMARGLKVLPDYSLQALYYVNLAASKVMEFSDMATKPVVSLNSLGASLKAIFGRK